MYSRWWQASFCTCYGYKKHLYLRHAVISAVNNQSRQSSGQIEGGVLDVCNSTFESATCPDADRNFEADEKEDENAEL